MLANGSSPMKRSSAFQKAIGPLGVAATARVGMTENGDSDSISRKLQSYLPDAWGGTFLVVLLGVLVLQAARWSIYLQPQFFLLKPVALLATWGLFVLTLVWRNRRFDVSRTKNEQHQSSDVRQTFHGDGPPIAGRSVATSVAENVDLPLATAQRGDGDHRDLSIKNTVRSLGYWPNILLLLVGLLVILSGPIVEWVNRAFDTGDPPEFIAFDLALSVALLLCVASSSRWRQAAIVGTSFVALLVTFAKPDGVVYVAAGVFGVVGLWRMMATYWEGIESKAIDSSSRQLPFRFSILSMTLVAILLLGVVASVFNRDALGWTSRWSIFSGGDEWSDPYATSGVGDGENLVAATQNAQSEGPIDSDMFIESKQRSLYDVITELNGDKKPTPKTETSQAIGIRTENYMHNHGRLAKVEKNTSSFQTSRTSKSRPRPKPEDAISDALLLVSGVAPTHLSLESFDLFDGETWFKSEATYRREMYGVLPGEQNEWFCLKRSNPLNVLFGLHNYSVAVLHLKSERIPLPPLIEAWSIGHINQARFYRTTPDDGLELAIGNTIPEMTVIRTIRRGFRLRDLPRRAFWRDLPRPPSSENRVPQLDAEEGTPLPYLELPLDDPTTERLKSLARQWSHGSSGGWEDVTRIVEGLRREFRHARPESTSLPEFLESGSGPDYLFATAAVLMLRAEGIPARMVSGFYVDPKKHDPRTGKTPVGVEDAHFWAEVHMGDGNWIPVEPTPGYEPTAESLSWLDRCVQALIDLAFWARDHWLQLLIAILVLLGAWSFREAIRHFIMWTMWRLELALRPQRRVVATLRYLEYLGHRAGLNRSQHQPVGTWLSETFSISNRVVPPSLLRPEAPQVDGGMIEPAGTSASIATGSHAGAFESESVADGERDLALFLDRLNRSLYDPGLALERSALSSRESRQVVRSAVVALRKQIKPGASHLNKH